MTPFDAAVMNIAFVALALDVGLVAAEVYVWWQRRYGRNVR